MPPESVGISASHKMGQKSDNDKTGGPHSGGLKLFNQEFDYGQNWTT